MKYKLLYSPEWGNPCAVSFDDEKDIKKAISFVCSEHFGSLQDFTSYCRRTNNNFYLFENGQIVESSRMVDQKVLV